MRVDAHMSEQSFAAFNHRSDSWCMWSSGGHLNICIELPEAGLTQMLTGRWQRTEGCHRLLPVWLMHSQGFTAAHELSWIVSPCGPASICQCVMHIAGLPFRKSAEGLIRFAEGPGGLSIAALYNPRRPRWLPCKVCPFCVWALHIPKAATAVTVDICFWCST